MSRINRNRRRGTYKAAVLLVSLGPEIAGEVYRYLSDAEIERITMEIATLGNIPTDDAQNVMEEFHQTVLAQSYIAVGGMTQAREILDQALGQQQSRETLARLQATLESRPFEFARRLSPEHLAGLIGGEHPQTIALVLSHLDAPQSSGVLALLPAEIQSDVAIRIATMDGSAPEIIREIERILERKIATVLAQDSHALGGVEALAELLNRVDRTTERNILEGLADQDLDLAEAVRKHMFVFEDVVKLDDHSVQTILKEVDPRELAIMLKGASDQLREKIFSNMSRRAAEFVREDMELLGPVRLRVVEETQQRCVAIIRRLEAMGEIFISHRPEEMVS